MEPISGISLERYAELCAKMNDVFPDKDACIKIAESEGIAKENWNEAHSGWQSRLTDPEDMGKTASKFEILWHEALNKTKKG